MSNFILNPGEVDIFVQSLKKTEILHIGSLSWFEQQQQLEKLRQQCLFEAANCVYERVKDVILAHEKLPILVFEAICMQVWRERVLKKVLQTTNIKLKHGFVGYTILYHECIAVNFLQILLHHRDAVQTMTDEAVDLIDYCAYQCAGLCSLKEKEKFEVSLKENELTWLEESEREMAMNRGLSSLAIIASFSEYLDDLSVSSIDRLYNTHDFPILVVNLLEVQPWKRINLNTKTREVYNEGQWSSWSAEELCKSEAQCWFILRGLLLHEAAKQYYNVSEYRKQILLTIQKYLHEHIIDQISPLIELRQFLSHLSVSNPSKVMKNPLLLEPVAEIRYSLLAQGKKWRELTERNIKLLFDGDNDEVMEIAKRMSETYDGAILVQEGREEKQSGKCQLCGKLAAKKCSQCHSAWYCSRECQVKSWKNHKSLCEQLKTSLAFTERV